MKRERATIVSDSADKEKSLEAALASLEKNFGKGTVMRLDAAAAQEEIEKIPTGSLGLDIAIGIGGIPRGRIVEIYGPESSGKNDTNPPYGS